jgi:hypothetical protein
VILIRTTTLPHQDANVDNAVAPFTRLVAEMQKLVEAERGTLVVAKQDGRTILSLRLPQVRDAA